MALSVGGILFEYLVLLPALRQVTSRNRAAELALVPAGAAEGPASEARGSAAEDITLPIAPRLGRCASLIALGAFLVAFCELGALVITPWTFADDSGHWPLK